MVHTSNITKKSELHLLAYKMLDVTIKTQRGATRTISSKANTKEGT